MELFTFIRMGGARERITVVELTAEDVIKQAIVQGKSKWILRAMRKHEDGKAVLDAAFPKPELIDVFYVFMKGPDSVHDDTEGLLRASKAPWLKILLQEHGLFANAPTQGSLGGYKLCWDEKSEAVEWASELIFQLDEEQHLMISQWIEAKRTKDFVTAFHQGVPPDQGPTNVYGLTILPPTEAAGPPIVGPAEASDSWNDTIFRFTANWNVTPNNLLYASYAEGYKSGGIHNRGVQPEFLAYDPESVKSYEVGSKNVLMDGRVTLNLAAFRTDREGVQAASVITLPNNQPPGTNTIVKGKAAVAAGWVGARVRKVLPLLPRRPLLPRFDSTAEHQLP